MLKIGIISDTHGDINPQIVSLINRCDMIIHAGDIVDIKALQKLNPKRKIIAVAGNNDTHLSGFEDVQKLDLPGGKLVVEHGHQHGYQQPSHSSLRRAYADAKLIVYGHTHKQIIDKTQTPWVINPGAGGEVRNYGGAKCMILTINDDKDWQITPHKFAQNSKSAAVVNV